MHERIIDRLSYARFVELDLRAQGLDSWRWWYRYRYPEMYYQTLLRRVEYLATRRDWLGRLRWAFGRLRLARESVRTGISIPPGVFGPGLSIAHYGSIIVNDSSRIGAFCRIHSATNIGASHGGTPTLGDYVYVAPGAVIHGPVKIGDGVAVGANAVVGRDVPPWCTVVGAGRIIEGSDSRKVLPEWIVSQMPKPESDHF